MLGTIDDLKPRLQLEAHRQSIGKAPKWRIYGARGFWHFIKNALPNVLLVSQTSSCSPAFMESSVYQTGNPTERLRTGLKV